jgi:translocation and assembly module TamA
VGRSGFAAAASSALILALSASPALADVPKASVEGQLDKGLRKEIERAIGESKTRPDSRFDARRRAREAAEAAIAVLRSEGYYAYEVTPDVSEGEPPQGVVRVNPGQRFTFRDLQLQWIGEPPAPDVAKAGLDAVQLHPGEPGRAADVLAAEGRIVAAVQHHGYADVEARPRIVSVDHADRSVNPTFNIAAGELVKLDGVNVVTDGRTNPNWVRGLAPWKSGDPYDPDDVAELERRLLDVGVYDSVTVALATKDKSENGLRPVVVSLADRPPRTLELGAGYSTSDGPGFDAKWVHYNRLHRADALTFTAKAARIEQRLDVELALPHWRRPGQTLKIGGGFLGHDTDAYRDGGLGVRVDVERRYTRTTYVTVGVAADYTQIDEKRADNPLATPVGETLKLGILTFLTAFALDRSNDPLNPTTGWRLEARAEPTGIAGDRTLAYVKTQAQASVYVPLRAKGGTVIAGRIKLGSILGGKLPDVPADRRFYAGGGGSVRGYAYQAVGPRLLDNTPQGGLSLFEASVEVRQKVSDRWGVVAFLDTGAVGTNQTPDFRNTSAGAGVGVRYDLGFGPFRVDLAVPLNRRKGDAKFQAYLSIGQSF